MKNKLVSSILFFAFLCSLFHVQKEVFAEKTNMSPNFTVKANLPDNQLEDATGYFHLSMQGGQEQQLEVSISNTTDTVISVYPSLATATTNSNGVISYKGNGKQQDNSLSIDFESISSLGSENIVLQPLETKSLTIDVKIPETEVKGQLLGGISFEEGLSADKNESSSMVVNRFSYNIAVMIEVGNEMPENELQLNEVFAAQRSGFNFIEVNLQNTAEKMISSLAVDASIYPSGKEEPIYMSNRTGLKMAPNSNFNYGIDLKQTPIKAGDYKIELSIIADDKTYKFEKEFMITTEEANHLNETAVLVETPNDSSLIIVISLAIGVLILIIGLLAWKKMKAKR